MLPECHSSIICHSKDRGGVGVWYGGVVERYGGLSSVFVGPGGDECKC